MENEEKKGVNPVTIVIVIAAVIAVIALVLLRKQEYTPVLPGSAAIDFTLPDISGKQRSLKEFKGKVVFLNFWATWCKTCEEEMPSMQALYGSLNGMPFEIVAVSVDSEGPEKVEAFAKKYNLTFPVLHDRNGRLKEIYKTTGVPETFIIDQNGIIAEKVVGPKNWMKSENLGTIAELLRNGPKPAQSYRK